MKKAAFLSEGLIAVMDDGGKIDILNCFTAEKYREREREIRSRKEWKQSGSGAMFTGAWQPSDAVLDIRLPIGGLSQGMDGKLAFTLNFDSGGGIYFKPLDAKEPETPIFVDLKTSFFELAVSQGGNVAVSCSDSFVERHIAFLKVDSPHLQRLTEGDCVDCNPSWSRANDDVLYYDSAGIAYSSDGRFAGLGPRSVYRLNIKTGQLDEVLSDDKFDYTSPFEDENGVLYAIRRPYKTGSGKMSARDFAKAPGKVMRAFGGWLDFVTRRYTGESLNTSGANPAKGNQRSPQQIFVDGNMLEAEKTLKKNAAAGDKNPGIIPKSWELIKITNGTEEILQTSVMGYCITPSGIVYSNGKYVISDKTAAKTHVASKLVAF